MTGEVQAILSRADPAVRDTYAAILSAVQGFGPVAVELKKASVHLVAGSAFAGIHPQIKKLRLNIRLARKLQQSRIRKAEQVSASRFHNEMDLASTTEVDGEVIEWLSEAYELGLRR